MGSKAEAPERYIQPRFEQQLCRLKKKESRDIINLARSAFPAGLYLPEQERLYGWTSSRFSVRQISAMHVPVYLIAPAGFMRRDRFSIRSASRFEVGLEHTIGRGTDRTQIVVSWSFAHMHNWQVTEGLVSLHENAFFLQSDYGVPIAGLNSDENLMKHTKAYRAIKEVIMFPAGFRAMSHKLPPMGFGGFVVLGENDFGPYEGAPASDVSFEEAGGDGK